MGRAGAGVLLRLIREEAKPEDWSVRLPLTFLERDTTGPALRKDRKLLRSGAA
jgi:LacI family transcriptional regulator, repressor for deo operon, udp, cdd, tsx, nupC, and nupG